jgi:hypothetical protein
VGYHASPELLLGGSGALLVLVVGFFLIVPFVRQRSSAWRGTIGYPRRNGRRDCGRGWHAMASGSPEDVIRAYLSSPSVPIATQPVPGAVGWRSEVSEGGCDAKLETIRFVKVRGIPGRQVHAVTFETQDGRPMSDVCYVRQDDAGDWRFMAAAGGSANGSPQREYPWVNLGSGGWPRQFFAGGRVLDNGREVVRVRLRAANGVELEDTVDDGLVLFLTDDEVHVPVEAALIDRGGTIISRHVAIGR